MLGDTVELVAIDSTGYENGHTSHYYGWRTGVKKRHFPKITALCDTKSYLYIAAAASQGPRSDDPEFTPVVQDAFALAPFSKLVADAGFDSEAHHRLVRETLGAESIIPPSRGRPRKRPPSGRYRRLLARDFPRSTYGQRWQLESCFSQDKRRFGSAVEGRSYYARCRKLHLRLLVPNIALILLSLYPTTPLPVSNAPFQRSSPDPFVW